MKQLLLSLPAALLFCSASCTENRSKPATATTEKATQSKPQLSVQPKDIESSEPSPLFDSLTTGFDLHTFFAEMQFTNNGGTQQEIYYFRPPREGFYYSYFGSPHFSGDIFGKLTLITYIYGSGVGRYNEQDETLIGINCRVNDTALGKLDLVGKPDDLFRKHPARVRVNKHRIVLQENEQLLVLFCEEDTIRAFRYIRVKNRLNDLTQDERHALLY